MTRLYLAVEGDRSLPTNQALLSASNVKKLGASEGDLIVYEDVPSKIEGTATIKVAGVGNDAIIVNLQLYNQWSDKTEWFGTLEVRLKEKRSAPISPPVSATPPVTRPPVSTPTYTPSVSAPTSPAPSSVSSSFDTGDVDLDSLLDSLIEEDLQTMEGAAPPAPAFTPPVAKSPSQYPSRPVSTPQPARPSPSIPVSRPTVPTPQPSRPSPTIPVSRPSTPSPRPSRPSTTIPVSRPSTPPPAPAQPSYPTTPSPPAQAPSTYPSSYPSAPAAYPSVPTSYPAAPAKQLARPDDFLTLTIELQYGLDGMVVLSQGAYASLALDPYAPAPVIFEDTATHAMGGAIPVSATNIPDNVVRMEPETYESSDITSLEVNLWSSVPKEPPIVKVDRLDLKVRLTNKGIGSTVALSQRNCLSLEVETGDVITFEDELIGAWGAGYIRMDESVPNDMLDIESEIFEATGIGSDDVVVRRNDKTIVPLQSLELGISPIHGEALWETITHVRNNKEAMKQWLSQFLIFKGLKLRWTDANAAINILSTVPDLKGEVLAAPKVTSSLQLKAEGLVTFNAILVIDISASMLAPDLLCNNIAPAIEGIKAAMDNQQVIQFLSRFREGVNVPRRLGAAFAALLFLAEKVGRGFGEKVSIIRFADEAEILQFSDPSGNPQFYFDSASGKHGILETAAIEIVDKIGNYKGLATNMAKGFMKAKQVLDVFRSIEGEEEKPCMMILLTDGYPTDEVEFLRVINQHFLGNPNLVLYILGIGTPNEEVMRDIASRSGGEYYTPEDLGSLLIWYSKRARDLVVKLKGGRAASYSPGY